MTDGDTSTSGEAESLAGAIEAPTTDTAGIVERDDHDRGCEGRTYSCTCGYDDRIDATIAAQAAEIERLREFVHKVEVFFLHRIRSENCFGSSMTANEIGRARAENEVSEGWIKAARNLTRSQNDGE